MNAKQIFERAITQQEKAVKDATFKFDDETQEEFDEKVARRVSIVCVGIGNARGVPGINEICPGQDATWEGYRINRRRVDQLDNVYVSRA